MLNRNCPNTGSSDRSYYKAQALALILIVLVVAVIIGLAVYARTLQDRRRVTEEKSSAEAIQLSDSILNATFNIPNNALQTYSSTHGNCLTDTVHYPDGCLFNSLSDINSYVRSALQLSIDPITDTECPTQNSTVSMTLKLVDGTSDYVIPKDSVWSIHPHIYTSGCTYNFIFTPSGDTHSGVEISSIKAIVDANTNIIGYPTYEYNDIYGYCFAESAGSCNSTNFEQNWQPYVYSTNSQIQVPVGLTAAGTVVDELRVRAVGSDVKAAVTAMPATCPLPKFIRITANTNCNGNYRAKYIDKPADDSALPIFDYVLFNGAGVLYKD